MDIETAIKTMWSVCDKPERVRVFHKIVFDLGVTDPKQFWSNFWAIWTSSENLFEDSNYYPSLIRRGLELGDPKLGLEDDEVEALEAFPSMITVYRGCLEENRDGWSWTTDRAKAKWFAERAFLASADTDRYVMIAQAPREKIIGYHTGRNESEVVINPDDLLDIGVDEIFTAKSAPMSGFTFLAQSGRLDLMGGAEMDQARALMAASSSTAPYDRTIDKLEEVIAFLEWADSKQRMGYFKALHKILCERRDDPSKEPDRSMFEGGFAL